MAILIAKYEFEGPFEEVERLKDDSGLFAVLHCENGSKDYELVNLTQTSNIRQCIELSPSSQSACNGKTLFAALYTPGSGVRERRAMVEEIQLEFADTDDIAQRRT